MNLLWFLEKPVLSKLLAQQAKWHAWCFIRHKQTSEPPSLLPSCSTNRLYRIYYVDMEGKLYNLQVNIVDQASTTCSIM